LIVEYPLATLETFEKMKVRLGNDVYRACFHHALSSQAEEVMGLLIGEIISDDDGETVIDISALRIVQRIDKRKDRVEVSDEHMIEATQYAEGMSQKLKKPNLRVVGWYHSHPNITVWPSHVDLRTQFNYQMLDKDFIGLIFSVFSVEKTKKTHQYDVKAFQAKEDEKRELKQVLVPIEVTCNNDKMNAHVAEEMIRLSDVLCQENEDMAEKLKDKEKATETEAEYNARYGEGALATLKRDFAMQMGNEDDEEEEDYDVDYDIMASMERDTALQMGYTDVFKHVTLPTIEQLVSETLHLKMPFAPNVNFVKQEVDAKEIKKEEENPGDKVSNETLEKAPMEVKEETVSSEEDLPAPGGSN